MTTHSSTPSGTFPGDGAHFSSVNDNAQPYSDQRQSQCGRTVCEVEELPPPPLAEPLISEAELARRVGLPVDVLIRHRNAGFLRGYRLRGQWRFSRQQMDDYVASLVGMS